MQLYKCKTCPFIQNGLTSFTFKNTGYNQRIKQTMTCASKNLIYKIQCRKCKNIPDAPTEYIGQTKYPVILEVFWLPYPLHFKKGEGPGHKVENK